MSWAAKQRKWDTRARRLTFAAERSGEAKGETGPLQTDWDRTVAAGRRRGELLLATAQITKLPSTFDVVALVIELEALGALHARRMMQETRINGEDRKALRGIGTAAKRLQSAIRDVLDDELRSEAAFALTVVMPGLARPWSDECRYLNNNAVRLDFLRHELAALRTVAKTVSKAAAQQNALFPSKPSVTALVRLLTEDLPALFKRHFHRRCGFGNESGGTGQATEGARFITAARAHLELGNRRTSAVNKLRQRKLKDGERHAPKSSKRRRRETKNRDIKPQT